MYDVCEVSRGEDNLSRVATSMGLNAHIGFELSDGDCGDVLNSTTMLAIVGLICQRVVAYIHCAPPKPALLPGMPLQSALHSFRI